MSRCGHVALAGRPNVGKSSLMNALVGEHLSLVSPKAQATRLPVIGLRSDPGTQYIFHDLPGLLDPAYLMQERMRALALEGIAGADLILHLHPATDAPSPGFVSAARLERSPRAPVLTVYTKADLVPEEARQVGAGEAALWVSAATGEGLPQLLAEVAGRLPEGPFQFDPDDLAAQPLRFFVVVVPGVGLVSCAEQRMTLWRDEL